MSARTNLFSLPALIGFSIYFEPEGRDKKADEIFIQFQKVATAALEVVDGGQDEGIHNYLTSLISARIIERGGYIEALDEDVPFDYVVQYEEDGNIYPEHHLFRFCDENFTLHMTVLDDFNLRDVEIFRNYLSRIDVHAIRPHDSEFGDVWQIEFDESSEFTRFGRRIFVNENGPTLEQVETLI